MRHAYALAAVFVFVSTAHLNAQVGFRDADQRAALAEELVASKELPGREFPAAYRALLVQSLKHETLEQLAQRRLSGNIATNALGNTRADLTYTPLASPCRIIDTRAMGGSLTGGSPGTARAFKVAGTAGFDLQGGTVGGCGIPLGATTVLINFVSVNPEGAGNIRGAAFPNAVPASGSIVNYQALTPALNIANGLLFPICDPTATTCSADINLSANGAGTDLVADVLGYGMRFPKENVKSFVVKAHNLVATAIPNGVCTNVPNLTVTITAPVAGTIIIHAQVMLQVSHTPGNTNPIHVALATTPDACAGYYWGSDFAFWDTGYAAAGLNFPILSLAETYSVAAGTTTTFYVNVNRYANLGDEPTTVMSGNVLIAEFVPD